MSFNKLIRVCGSFPVADQSALAAIHRALRGVLRPFIIPLLFR
jgi:hypothetical protein